MGNSPSLETEEENEAASMQAIDIFKQLDANADEAISADEWEKAFQYLDENSDGIISRKEWYVKQGSTEMYDAIHKKSSAHISREEWQACFEMLDTNKDGAISVAEWMSRRKVVLGFVSLGMTLNNWGVGVLTTGPEGTGSFYEVLATSATKTEMVVGGPEGILALGEFAKEESAKDKWLEGFKAEKGCEPRARPQEEWQDLEVSGWTMKSDEEIEDFLKAWVVEHPTFKGMDAFGNECNDQTFGIDLIAWLTGTNYSRMTDNTKGRAVVYGGLALLATGAGIYLANKMSKPAAEPAAKDQGPAQS